MVKGVVFQYEVSWIYRKEKSGDLNDILYL